MRRGAFLDLILTTKEGLMRDVKAKCSLGCGDHEMVFRVLRGGSWAKVKITMLDFRRAGFGLFRHLLDTVQWDKVLGRRPKNGRLILKDHYHAQERSILTPQSCILCLSSSCIRDNPS